MRVISICHQDYANFGYDNALAMRSVGIDAECFVLRPHPFYKKQAKVVSQDIIIKQIEAADIIIVMHSCGTMWDLVKNSGKRIIVFHTGTRYRQDPDKHNERWNDLAEQVVIALGEFETLGCKDPIFITMTIDTNRISPDYSFATDGKLRIAHYPSNPEVKGTDTINRIIGEVKKKHDFVYNHSTRIIGNREQIARMNQCDIYVELFAPEQGGKPYGSFGTTALEAACLGKVVVTNNMWQECYNAEYKDCALEIANDEETLYNKLESLLTMHRNDLLIKKMQSRRWVESQHGYKAQGERMKLLLNL